MKDNRGFIGLNKFFKDQLNMTEWQSAEISEGEAKYQSVFHNHHTAMLIIDSEKGEIIDANPAACHYYGYPQEIIVSMNISDINVLSQQEIADEMAKAKTEERKYFRFKHKLSSGEIRDVEVYSGPIMIENQLLLFSIIHDIQEKNEFIKRFKLQESYFKDLFENSPEAIAMVDNDYKIIDVNRSFEDIFLYSKNEVIDKNITKLLCDHDYYSESLYFKESISRGEFARKETLRQRKDNKLIDVSILGCPIRLNGEQIGVYCIYSDLSKIKEKEKKQKAREQKYLNLLRASKGRAEEASKLKSQFLANMSHEIRTPMNGIIGIIQLLKESQLSGENTNYIDMLEYSADRLLSIINDVLDISKIEAGKLEMANEPFNLNELLDKLIKYFNIQAQGKGLKLFSSCECFTRLFMGDSDRLNQVLFNLLGNAVKFTEKGNIFFEVELVEELEEQAKVRFSIRDTGIGIEKEKIKDLFQNFSQIDSESNKKYKGTGLGLVLSKRLVEMMGGFIEVQSKYGEGSIFSFTVVLGIDHADNDQPKADEEDDNGKDFLKGLKILVAEDERINQEIIRSLLEKQGCNITITDNGKDVIKKLDVHDYDLILMDLHMPEIDGYEITRNIRNREELTGEHIPIIATTAAAMKEDLDRCFNTGFDGYVTKPIIKKNIFTAIKKVLTNKTTYADFKTLSDRLCDDTQLMKEIIDLVTSDQYENEFLGAMRKSIEEKNYEKLGELIHKLKGSLSCFESVPLNNCLEEMKESLNGEDDLIDVLYQKLRNEFHQFKNDLMLHRIKM